MPPLPLHWRPSRRKKLLKPADMAFMAGGRKRCPWCSNQMEERDMVCTTCKRVDFLGALKDNDIRLGVIVVVLLLSLAALLIFAVLS
jgi:hypothetical protein